MRLRSLLAAAGAGLTTSLVVAVLVIEALPFEFSALVGLPVGVLAGLLAAALVATRYGVAGRAARSVVDAVAAFGYAVLGVLAVQYVDLAGLRSAVTLPKLLGVAALAALTVLVASWVTSSTSD